MAKGNRLITFFKSRKVNIFLLFLLLALLFSVLTKLSQDYTKTLTLGIVTINVPEDKVIVQDSMQELEVTLSTYGFKLVRYYFNKPSINLNVSAMDRNELFYIWTEQKGFSEVVSQFDANVTINNVNPDTLKFRYDSNAVKMIPVEFISEITFAPGYDSELGFKIEPDSVKVIGPQILVDSINSVKTMPLKLSDVKASISTQVGLESLSNDQLRTSINQINISAEVERFTEGTIDVPVIVKNVPEAISLNIYPKTVQVIYYASLNEFKSIASNSFIVECDYNDVLDGEVSFLIPRITQQPDHVKGARLDIKRIEFIVSK